MTGFLFRLIGRLPLVWNQRLGALLGHLMVRLSPGYAQMTDTNLAQAGYADAGLRERVITESGRMVLEWAWVWNRSHGALLGAVDYRAAEPVARAALRRGKGVIFLTPHLGCFEVTAQAYAAVVGPITVLYSPPKLPWLQQMIDAGRNKSNVTLAPATLAGVRMLMRALKNGEAVGILPDQTPRDGEGLWAPFFGRPAYTMSLVARLHQLFDAPILLAFGERLPDAQGFRVHAVPFDQPLAAEPLEAATQINHAVEDLIRTCPEQYLWGYNRYKAPKPVPNTHPQ